MNKQEALKELERIDKLHEKGIIGNLEHKQLSKDVLNKLEKSLSNKFKVEKRILGNRR
jgi:hypothetical protein